MKYTAILFGLLHFLGTSEAQVKEPVFATPNAASLGKYGDIPVSHHTGVPNIDIPIYNVAEGALTLPISLSYHSAGIRVSEMASWVGLGWSLNAGGMITRTVNGGPDEGIENGGMPGAQSPYTRWGWYKDYGQLPELLACSDRPISSEGPQQGTFPSWGGCASIYFEAANGYIDTEPDLFTFNFNGQSGKFFFDANRKVHMIPESDFHIVPINSPSYFYAWKIIAPDGTKYFFGGVGATEVSCANPYDNNGNREVASSDTWYLYRMESANGESWIDLEYVDDTYSFGNRGGQSVSFRMKWANPSQPPPSGSPNVFGDVDNSSFILGVSIVDGKQLTKITTSSGYTEVDFIPSSAARQDLSKYVKDPPYLIFNTETANTISKPLQFIDIHAGVLCKKFELSHDYFGSADCTGCIGSSWYGSDFDKKRLRLNWLQEVTCTGQATPKYEFFYNGTTLPRRYSLARDWWEYYNGHNGNDGLLEDFANPSPNVSITYTTGDFRTVNETSMQAGILTKIKYPTGGANEFTYEAHRTGDLSTPRIGGLRVKEVVTTDDMGGTQLKSYEYQNGALYFDPKNYMQQYPNNASGLPYVGESDFGVTVVSSPFPPMWSSMGYHIGYTNLTTRQQGIGSTTFTFNNTPPANISQFQFPVTPVVAVIGTSNLYFEATKKEDNTTVSSTDTFNSIMGTPTTVQSRRVVGVNCINCIGRTDFGLGRDYSISTWRYTLQSKTEIRDGLETSTVNTYDAQLKHNNPRTSQITDSKGIVRKTEFTYASDTGSGAPAAMTDPADSNFKNMLGMPVELRTYVNNAITGKATTSFTQTGSRVLISSTRNYPTGTTDFTETQYDYDTQSNLIGIRPSNGLNTAYVWGYNGTLPIAEVKNTLHNKVFFEGFEDGSGVAIASHTGLRSHSGAYTVTLPSAGTYTLTYWKSVSGGPWQFVQVTGVTANQTIGATGTDIDDVRLFPSVAQMTTFNYSPGIGIMSVTDHNNRTSYYVYDARGRLSGVKDNEGNLLTSYQYHYKGEN